MSTRWDQKTDVRSPVGRSITELLEPGARRQDLPGFDPVYRDFVDYIIRCTHRIWEEKNIGLCRSHYSDDCVIHTLAGPVRGKEAVVQNTIATLSAFPDRTLVGEDVIWSEDAPGTFYSSHRIASGMTHGGIDPQFGAPTGKRATVTTIADCLCRQNRIIEEWLVRDNLSAAWQLDVSPWDLARAQAEADRAGDAARHQWRADAIERVRKGTDEIRIDAGHPAEAAAAMIKQAFVDTMFGAAAETLSEAAEIRWPSGRHGFGRGFWIGCVTQLSAMLHDRAVAIEHVAARPLPAGDIAVAIRWSLAGKHRGAGVWGEPTGRDLLVMAVSQSRVRQGRIVEEVCVFDELAVLRQVLGGLGA